jgi:hypothetical protein
METEGVVVRHLGKAAVATLHFAFSIRREATWRLARALSVFSTALCVVCLVNLLGCSGSGTVHGVPLTRRDIPETATLVQSLSPIEAYYWIEEAGEVTVSMRYEVPSMLGAQFDAEWIGSLVVDEMPAGSEKLYTLNQESLRVLQGGAASRGRMKSLMGVAVLHGLERDILRGRFHTTTRQQRFTMLDGWAPEWVRAPVFVLCGEFEAVRNETEAMAIRRETEADGLERKTTQPPATQPTPKRSKSQLN